MTAPANFKPLNPWGRGFPKPPKPVLDKPESLYQLWVDELDGTSRPIMPKVIKQVAEMFLYHLNKALIDGRIKTWKNARLVLAK